MSYRLHAEVALQNLAMAYPDCREQDEPLVTMQLACFVSQDYWGMVLSSPS